MKFLLNLQNVQLLGKNELKQIKGGKPLTAPPTCANIPSFSLVSPDMCPV